MQVPHPVKIFNAIRIIIGMAFFAIGILGMVHLFYSDVIPAEIVSLILPEFDSISQASTILIVSFVSLFLGPIILMRKNEH